MLPLRRNRRGHLFRRRCAFQHDAPAPDAHTGGRVQRAGAHLALHRRHGPHLLPGTPRALAHSRLRRRRHGAGRARVALRRALRRGLGAAGRVRRCRRLPCLHRSERTPHQLLLRRPLHAGLAGAVLFLGLRAQQRARTPPADPHPRAPRHRGRPHRSRL